MLKNLRNMKVKDRLVRSFVFVTLMASFAGVLGAFLMLGLDARYGKALELNGLSKVIWVNIMLTYIKTVP